MPRRIHTLAHTQWSKKEAPSGYDPSAHDVSAPGVSAMNDQSDRGEESENFLEATPIKQFLSGTDLLMVSSSPNSFGTVTKLECHKSAVKSSGMVDRLSTEPPIAFARHCPFSHRVKDKICASLRQVLFFLLFLISSATGVVLILLGVPLYILEFCHRIYFECRSWQDHFSDFLDVREHISLERQRALFDNYNRRLLGKEMLGDAPSSAAAMRLPDRPPCQSDGTLHNWETLQFWHHRPYLHYIVRVLTFFNLFSSKRFLRTRCDDFDLLVSLYELYLNFVHPRTQLLAGQDLGMLTDGSANPCHIGCLTITKRMTIDELRQIFHHNFLVRSARARSRLGVKYGRLAWIPLHVTPPEATARKCPTYASRLLDLERRHTQVDAAHAHNLAPHDYVCVNDHVEELTTATSLSDAIRYSFARHLPRDRPLWHVMLYNPPAVQRGKGFDWRGLRDNVQPLAPDSDFSLVLFRVHHAMSDGISISYTSGHTLLRPMHLTHPLSLKGSAKVESIRDRDVGSNAEIGEEEKLPRPTSRPQSSSSKASEGIWSDFRSTLTIASPQELRDEVFAPPTVVKHRQFLLQKIVLHIFYAVKLLLMAPAIVPLLFAAFFHAPPSSRLLGSKEADTPSAPLQGPRTTLVLFDGKVSTLKALAKSIDELLERANLGNTSKSAKSEKKRKSNIHITFTDLVTFATISTLNFLQQRHKELPAAVDSVRIKRLPSSVDAKLWQAFYKNVESSSATNLPWWLQILPWRRKPNRMVCFVPTSVRTTSATGLDNFSSLSLTVFPCPDFAREKSRPDVTTVLWSPLEELLRMKACMDQTKKRDIGWKLFVMTEFFMRCFPQVTNMWLLKAMLAPVQVVISSVCLADRPDAAMAYRGTKGFTDIFSTISDTQKTRSSTIKLPYQVEDKPCFKTVVLMPGEHNLTNGLSCMSVGDQAIISFSYDANEDSEDKTIMTWAPRLFHLFLQDLQSQIQAATAAEPSAAEAAARESLCHSPAFLPCTGRLAESPAAEGEACGTKS